MFIGGHRNINFILSVGGPYSSVKMTFWKFGVKGCIHGSHENKAWGDATPAWCWGWTCGLNLLAQFFKGRFMLSLGDIQRAADSQFLDMCRSIGVPGFGPEYLYKFRCMVPLLLLSQCEKNRVANLIEVNNFVKFVHVPMQGSDASSN